MQKELLESRPALQPLLRELEGSQLSKPFTNQPYQPTAPAPAGPGAEGYNLQFLPLRMSVGITDL